MVQTTTIRFTRYLAWPNGQLRTFDDETKAGWYAHVYRGVVAYWPPLQKWVVQLS